MYRLRTLSGCTYRSRLARLLWLPLLYIVVANAPAQTDTVRERHAEAESLRQDAAKQRALAQEYRDQAESVRRRATEARAQATAARAAGKSDRALSLEQQARSDDNEAARRLDTAANYDREAERLLEIARDKDASADRIAQDAAPRDAATAAYQRTLAYLHDASARVATLRTQAAARWLGKSYDAHDYERDKPFNEEVLTYFYDGPDAWPKAFQASLEAAWSRYKDNQSDAAGLAAACYRVVSDAEADFASREFSTAIIYVKFFTTEVRRTDGKLSEERERLVGQVEAQYAAGTITYAQKQSAIAQIDERQSAAYKQMFDALAAQYRQVLYQLARFRRDELARLKKWHDWAQQQSRDASDVHANAAHTFDDLAFRIFSERASPNVQLNAAGFAFTVGSPDRLNTRCDGCAWCKPGLYSDIQDPDSPSMFRMWAFVDVKVEDSIAEGTVAGAAATEAP